jgi:hypothetical protein
MNKYSHIIYATIDQAHNAIWECGTMRLNEYHACSSMDRVHDRVEHLARPTKIFLETNDGKQVPKGCCARDSSVELVAVPGPLLRWHLLLF